MGPKEAVTAAKQHIVNMFDGEGIRNIGLEEIESQGSYWKITIGFSRNWDSNITAMLGTGGQPRSYKVVEIHQEDGEFFSIKDRTLPDTPL